MASDEQEAQQLRKRAKALKKKLSKHWTKKSGVFLFVEFAGSPKSGKSSCINIVDNFFRRLDFKVNAPTEGASKRTPYYLKENLVAYNAWNASYALSHILEGVYGSDRFHLAILDRGLFDSLAWFEVLTNEGKLSKKDRDTIHSFLMLDQWRKHIRQLFLFKAHPQTSLSRENENNLIEEPGITMNSEFLEKLNAAYDTIKEKFRGIMPELREIDTSIENKSTARSTALVVTVQILNVMEQQLGHAQ